MPLVGLVALISPTVSHGGFLFTNTYESGRESFITPKIDYNNTTGRYSEWDNFYSRYSVGNLPDVWAKFGGNSEWKQDDEGEWYVVKTPLARPLGDPDFPYSPYYNSNQPNAFWDVNNPTITQTGAPGALVTGGGNIYSWSEKVSFKLEDNTTQGLDFFTPGLVVFQFQTDGALVDFANIKLVYTFGDGSTGEILATDLDFADYLREYQPSAGSSGNEFTGNGYRNRVAIQWDLSDITDPFGNPVTSYSIEWGALLPSMSLQQVALDTSDTFERSLPSHRAWLGGDGSWSSGNWFQYGKDGGYVGDPEANGNVLFDNEVAANINVIENHTAGELIFRTANNVTLNADEGIKLTVNTGITTTAGATGVYTINSDYVLGSLNVFEINAGTVVMGGVVSGAYDVVKSGSGTLVFAANNTFDGSLLVDNGTVRLESANQYTKGTTLLNGKLIVAADAFVGSGALGTSTGAVLVGADETVYQNIERVWSAELQIDGAHTVGHDVNLAAGDNSKVLSAVNTGTSGAEFSGGIHFTTPSADPDSLLSAAGNVSIKAVGANDILRFSGNMEGGSSASTVTLNGAGTVIYTGAEKTYRNATVVSSGALVLDQGTTFSGAGDMTVSGSGRLTVNGVLGGEGALALEDGAKLGGSGVINRTFTVANGTVLAPGNSPGTLTTIDQTWGGGGILDWEINDATGTEGVNWDSLDIQGTLTITATADDRFVLSLSSLTLASVAGEASNFDWDLESGEGYSWLIATTEGVNWSGVGNFSDLFAFDTTGFFLGGDGYFSVALLDDTDLHLKWTAVPEPSTWVLTGMAAAWGLLQVLRRRRNSGQEYCNGKGA